MLTPGPAEGGAQKTNILSPTTNSDQSALNLRTLMKEAGLAESVCVFWNAVPWALERRRDPTTAEPERGVVYLKEFLALLRETRAVVALGRVAQRACALADVKAIEVPSPSPLAVAAPGVAAQLQVAALDQPARRIEAGRPSRRTLDTQT